MWVCCQHGRAFKAAQENQAWRCHLPVWSVSIRSQPGRGVCTKTKQLNAFWVVWPCFSLIFPCFYFLFFFLPSSSFLFYIFSPPHPPPPQRPSVICHEMRLPVPVPIVFYVIYTPVIRCPRCESINSPSMRTSSFPVINVIMWLRERIPWNSTRSPCTRGLDIPVIYVIMSPRGRVV